VLQAAALTLCAIPAYRLGTRHLGGPWAGALAGLVPLLHPVLSQVNAFELHPVAFAVAPALWALEAADRGAFREAAIAAVLTAACKEDGLLFAGLLPLAFPLPRGEPGVRRDRWLRAGAVVVGVGGYALYAFWAKTAFGLTTQVQETFGALGATPAGVLASVARHPEALPGLLLGGGKAAYLGALIWPLLGLPLLAPRLLLPVLPLLLLNLLAALPARHRIVDSHYSALPLAALVAAAIVGAGRLTRRQTRSGLLCAAALLGAAAAGAAVLGAFPGASGLDAGDYAAGPRDQALRALIAPMLAQPEAPVSVPIDVVAHVAQRREPHIFPGGLDRVTFALVDLASDRPQGAGSDFRASLERRVERLVASGEMVVADRRGPLVLLRRVARPDRGE
jgi:hypothetical protein